MNFKYYMLTTPAFYLKKSEQIWICWLTAGCILIFFTKMCTNHIMPVWERKICICNREFLWNQIWTREKMWCVHFLSIFLFIYPLPLIRSILWVHMLCFIQGLQSVTQTMIHEDSQPLVSWVNIYVNVIQTGKLSHKEVVFLKKTPRSFNASFFWPIQLTNLQLLFFRCVECAYRSREVNENWITRAASGVTQVTGHVFV